MFILGFLGRKRSGKDTCVLYAQAHLASKGLSTAILRFAHPLKCLLSKMSGQPYALFDDDNTKERPIELTKLKSMYDTMVGFCATDWEEAKQAAHLFEPDFMDKVQLALVSFYVLLEQRIYQSVETSPRWLLQTLGTDCLRDTVSNVIWVNMLRMNLIKMAERGTEVVLIPDVRFKSEVAMLGEYQLASYIRVIRPSLATNQTSEQTHCSETELDDFTSPRLHEVTNDETKQVLQERLLHIVRRLIM